MSKSLLICAIYLKFSLFKRNLYKYLFNLRYLRVNKYDGRRLIDLLPIKLNRVKMKKTK